MGGNSYVLDNNLITDEGYIFSQLPGKLVTYFYGQNINSKKFTPVNISIKVKTSSLLTINIKVGSISISLNTNLFYQFKTYSFGQLALQNGYNQIFITLNGKFNYANGIVQSIKIQGEFKSTTYVQNNEDNMFYWGRRGPSGHLWWEPEVPKGNDIVGSYFMANGFTGGYFGYQVNSQTQRRFLFSIWKDDNSQVKLIKKGKQVYTGNFSGQGQGGQSYLIYPWKSDIKYSFLTKAEPLGTSTIFTAWFEDSQNPGWKLIAQWQRTNLYTYFSGLYSFIQCFSLDTGNILRKAYYSNQWIYNQITNQWKEITKVTFTKGDKNQRRDIQGGVQESRFYLRQNGLFNETTDIYTEFTRKSQNKMPNIIFQLLP